VVLVVVVDDDEGHRWLVGDVQQLRSC